jgi:hypothetical protein
LNSFGRPLGKDFNICKKELQAGEKKKKRKEKSGHGTK